MTYKTDLVYLLKVVDLKIRIVADSNILISACALGSSPEGRKESI